jgi:hypothetical protein
MLKGERLPYFNSNTHGNFHFNMLNFNKMSNSAMTSVNGTPLNKVTRRRAHEICGNLILNKMFILLDFFIKFRFCFI